MSPTEIKFLLWFVSALLAILAFVGALGVNALVKMSRDINEIKSAVMVQSTKHDGLEKRVEHLEDKFL